MKKRNINTQDVLSMRGAGYYSERTAGARDVINEASDMVIAALNDLPASKTLKLQIMARLMVVLASKCGARLLETSVAPMTCDRLK